MLQNLKLLMKTNMMLKKFQMSDFRIRNAQLVKLYKYFKIPSSLKSETLLVPRISERDTQPVLF